LHAKLLAEFELHPFRVYEDMVGQPILDSQSEPIEGRVFRIPNACIHIVHCKNDLFPQGPVVNDNHRSIKGLKFVVPQDVKNSRLRYCGIANEPGVVRQNSNSLPYESNVWPLTASQIKKMHSGLTVIFRAIQIIAANQIQVRSLRDELRCQAECVGLVATTG
jgi:hypothetical protein